MVAAAIPPKILKRFWSDTFAPPAGFASSARGREVGAEEILSGGVRESDWSFPVLISTPNEDRVGDVVEPEGCNYGPFAESPICFFDHQEVKFPVGSLRGPDGRLYICIIPGQGVLGRIWIRKPTADTPPAYAEACQTVWILVRDGLLNGISAGFDPIGRVKELRSGGSLYEQWELLEISIVPIAANRDCRVLRGPFPWDEQVLKRFAPTVLKGLRSMPETVLKHIRKEGDKWVLYSHDMKKILGRHSSREGAERQEAAIKANEHKSLTESSGTGGGYTVAESKEHREDSDDLDIGKVVSARMVDHGDTAKGHAIHFHPETGEMIHYHPSEAKSEHVKAVADDLGDIPGVKHVVSTSDKRDDLGKDGYKAVYPCQTKSRPTSQRTLKRKQVLVALRVQHGKGVMAMLRKGLVNGFVHKSIEMCVHRKMPKLREEGYPEEQAIAIAFSMCGEAKGLTPAYTKNSLALVQKALGDDADAQPDADGDYDGDLDADVDQAPEAADRPAGMELAQSVIDLIESGDARLEPERREFWESIIKQVRDHGGETYPEEDFGGEDTAGANAEGGDKGLTTSQEANANDAEEQAVTNDMLHRYKRYPRKRRIAAARQEKGMKLPFGDDDAETIKKAANHCHEIGDMPYEENSKGGVLKGYTAAHHRKMRVVARALDRLHGKSGNYAERAGQEGDSQQTEQGRAGEASVEKTHQIALEKRLAERDSMIGELYYRATGKKVSANGTT